MCVCVCVCVCGISLPQDTAIATATATTTTATATATATNHRHEPPPRATATSHRPHNYVHHTTTRRATHNTHNTYVVSVKPAGGRTPVTLLMMPGLWNTQNRVFPNTPLATASRT